MTQKNHNQKPEKTQEQKNEELLELENKEKEAKEKADQEAKEKAAKAKEPPKEKKSKTNKKFNQVAYDRFVELMFISYQIQGVKNLKKEFQKELSELEEIVLANPGVVASESKTIFVTDREVKLVKGVPASDEVFNLFTEKQQAQYFEV